MSCTTDCGEAARFKVYAAYPVDDYRTHPTVARYPMPLATLCANCLAGIIAADSRTHGATPGYYYVTVAP